MVVPLAQSRMLEVPPVQLILGFRTQRDELAPLHSITSSARASSVGGLGSIREFRTMQIMMNARELSTLEFVDYTFVFN